MVVVVEGVFMGLDTHFLMGLDTHSMVVVIVATLLCLWMNDCRSVGWQYQWSMDLPYANRFYPDGNCRLSDRISELMVHIKSAALVLSGCSCGRGFHGVGYPVFDGDAYPFYGCCSCRGSIC